jgi:hypothetical protein
VLDLHEARLQSNLARLRVRRVSRSTFIHFNIISLTYFRCNMFLLNVIEIESTLDILPKDFHCLCGSGCGSGDFGESNIRRFESQEQELHLRDTLADSWVRVVAPCAGRGGGPGDDMAANSSTTTTTTTPSKTKLTITTSAGGASLPGASSSTSSQSSSGSKSDGKDQGKVDSEWKHTRNDPQQLWGKGHLLLVMPLAVRLAGCSHQQLRVTANEVMR